MTDQRRTFTGSGVAGSATASLARNFLIIAVALLLLKLLLVSQREIVTEPNDAEGYVSASLDDLGLVVSGAAYHAPGASLVMGLARSLGIPYRIFMEVFLAVAAFLFFRPLVVSMRLGIAAVTFSYGLLLFHPALILEMDRAMSDSVSFFCWLIGAGGIIGFVLAPRENAPWWSLGLAIASFAFAGITRSGEGLIVFVEMVAVASLSILLFHGVDDWRRRRAVVACLCAVAANFSATQALSAAHFVNSGYWGATAVESRQWWQLYSNLLSLPVQRNDRHVLVNKATMEIAETFSEDLHNMSACFQQVEAQHSTEELPNEGVAWVIIGCLPGENSSKNYARMRTISADIIDGAREHHLRLSAPILGVIPQPALQWLPDLPSSILRVAFDAVRIPDSTRVAQGSGREELFNRGLLRRTTLLATGENPEVVGYRSFIRIPYTVLAALFWPSVPMVFLVAAAIVIRYRRTGTKSRLIAFVLSVMIIDVVCRISFYSVVDWILWDLPPRYILGASVLTVVTVSTLLTVWLAPAVGGRFGRAGHRVGRALRTG
jgi:hypothetical protein